MIEHLQDDTPLRYLIAIEYRLYETVTAVSSMAFPRLLQAASYTNYLAFYLGVTELFFDFLPTDLAD